jgi:hypothetical protein
MLGTAVVLVALIATAFAVGGSGGASDNGGASGAPTAAKFAHANVGSGSATAHGLPALPPEAVPSSAPQAAEALPATAPLVPSAVGSGGVAMTFSNSARLPASQISDDVSSIDATKIVRTGELTLQVDKGDVPTAMTKLTALASDEGGYVAQSTTVGGQQPSGEVTLRIPVAHFDDAIAQARKLGSTTMLTTSANDVTGQYVDLSAKLSALDRTRSTYLTILSKATTIGATLAVQERIDSVQQEIDQLTGEIKLLDDQASYSTLDVSVSPTGAAVLTNHARHGLGKAWHTSWSRFARGVEAIVGAIGPLVLALLIVAFITVGSYIGYRGARRLVAIRRVTG